MWYICITFRALCGRNPFQPDWRTVLWKESRPLRPGTCVPALRMAAVGSARPPASLLARPAAALPTSSARTQRRLTGNESRFSSIYVEAYPLGKMDGACCNAETVMTVPYRRLHRRPELHAVLWGQAGPGCFAAGLFYLQRRVPFWYININSMASTSCWTPAPARSTPWTRWLMMPFLYMKPTPPRKSWINSWNNTPARPM